MYWTIFVFHFGVMGDPIEHSISPQLHAEFAHACGHDLVYERYHLQANDVQDFLEDFKKIGTGLNVTSPHKTRVVTLADRVTARTKIAQAANVLCLRQRSWIADSVDGLGLLRALQKHKISIKGKSVVILGAGAVVRSVLPVLVSASPKWITIAVRAMERVRAGWPETLSFPKISWADMAQLDQPFDYVIQATTAGLTGQCPTVSDALFEARSCVIDLNCRAAADPFLSRALCAGAHTVVDGQGMLIEQAALSYQIWTGVLPQTERLWNKWLKSAAAYR